jgi:hypothetical protein
MLLISSRDDVVRADAFGGPATVGVVLPVEYVI